MSSIGGGINLNKVSNDPRVGGDPLLDKKAATGAGLLNQQMIVPGGKTGANPGGQTFAAARTSLSAFMSDGPAVDTDVLLVQVAVSMRDVESTSQKAKINTDQESKKAQAKEKEAKLEEAQRKMEEAEAKKNSGSLIDKIKMAFDILAALASVVAAVLLIATGAGAVAGVGLIGSAVVATVMAVDSIVQATTGMGIAANIHLLLHPDDKEGAAKADMGFRISMAVIGMAFAVASCGTGAINGAANMAGAMANVGKSAATAGMSAAKAGASVAETAKAVGTVVKDAAMGAASAASTAVSNAASSAVNSVKTVAGAIQNVGTTAMNGVKTGASVGETVKSVAAAVKNAYQTMMAVGGSTEQAAASGTKVSEAVTSALSRVTGQSTDTVVKGLKIAGTVNRIGESTAQIGNIGSDVSRSALKFQETSATADARKLEASAKVDQAVMQMLDDMIDQALSRLMASGDRFSAMLDGITDAMQDRGNTMGRAQFRG